MVIGLGVQYHSLLCPIVESATSALSGELPMGIVDMRPGPKDIVLCSIIRLWLRMVPVFP